MGFLYRLFGGRFTEPPPDEPPLSDAAIMRELHPYRDELKAFTQSLLTRLPEKEQARLVRRVMRRYGQGEEPSSALTEGLLDPDKGNHSSTSSCSPLIGKDSMASNIWPHT